MSSTPSFRVFPTAEACAQAAARLFFELTSAAAAADRTFRVALSGGSTPKRLYAILAGTPEFRDRIPWSRIHFFFGDERHVPPDHPESNFGAARDGLFSKVAVPAANIHRILAERPEASEAASLYQNAVTASFPQNGAGAAPRFDLIFLGMGADGHTASLFPGTTALAERERWVVSTRVEKLNTDRITFTYPLINASARVLLLVTGEDKAERIGEIFAPAAPVSYPVQDVRPVDGTVEWYLDAAAARLLTPAPVAA